MAVDDNEQDTNLGRDGDSERDYLTPDELRVALGSLTAVDLKRLNRASEMLARDTLMSAEELVGEAVYVAFVGRRRCPRDVPLMVFLKGAIKSLASSAKKAAARSNIVPFPGATPENQNPIECASDLASTPEQVLLQRDEGREAEGAAASASTAVQMLNDHFSKDYEVQLCIAGMMEGMAGKELRDFVGVDQAGIDYARKKIRRATCKLFPRGWRNVQK
jgi:hypothetical protein